MSHRQSIYSKGTVASTHIPSGCRVGNIIWSSITFGRDPRTGKLPATLAEQTVNLFANIREVVERGGGSVEDIVKVTIWIRDRSMREALNEQWTQMFPDPQSRPARTTLQADLDGATLIQAEFMAVLAS